MKMPTCARIIFIAMDLFFFLIGGTLFVGSVYLYNVFPTTIKNHLAPALVADQSVVAIVGVAVVGVAMSMGSVFGGCGTVKNRDVWVLFASSLFTPCFATLFSLAVCILYYQNNIFEVMRQTMLYEADVNISNGLLQTGYVRYGCCGVADLPDGCDRTYPPVCQAGSDLCKKGCSRMVWNHLFVPYMNGTISALFTISGVLLAGVVLGIFVYRSIVEENQSSQRQRQQPSTSSSPAIALHNRAIKQE